MGGGVRCKVLYSAQQLLSQNYYKQSDNVGGGVRCKVLYNALQLLLQKYYKQSDYWVGEGGTNY